MRAGVPEPRQQAARAEGVDTVSVRSNDRDSHTHTHLSTGRTTTCSILLSTVRNHVRHRCKASAQPGESARDRSQRPCGEIPEPGLRVSAERLPGERAAVRGRLLRGAAFIVGLQ